MLATAFIDTLLTTPARADVIMDWHAKADTIAYQIPDGELGRVLAILHVAMFEAVNAIERRYAPYKLNLPADRNSSKEAAAAAAGYHVLVALYPDQKADLDATFVAMLAGVPEGEPKTKGADLGKKAAAEIIALRANDGADALESYRPHTTPGMYVPTAIPVFSTAGTMTPWTMTSGSQFRPAPPPASRRRPGRGTSTRSASWVDATARNGRPSRPRSAVSGSSRAHAPGTPSCGRSQRPRTWIWLTAPASTHWSRWPATTRLFPCSTPSMPTICGDPSPRSAMRI